MTFLKYIPVWLKSKYLITGLAFIVWMLFFDSDDITLQLKRVKELKQLQRSEKGLDQQITDTKKELELLRTNPTTLEKYARERYLMKKDNEDLYIIATDRKITQ
ncbi:MAG: septum formation initiator family protein [Ginsengibacter sp.]